ncbi:Shedu immune nuclease family protein [Flavobacterium psychrophilum]|uniref:Shedu immune nuclease family protein n=1 Tax=Flavobacterium psychrophilum TaxID=96345 RepID=UPI0009C04BC0
MNSLDILDDVSKKKIATLLSGEEGAKTIQSLLDNGTITSEDIVNTGYRKAQLKIFDRLLKEEHYLQEYKIEESNITNLISEFETKIQKTIDEKTKDEIAWQYFFNKNPWIFGYGLDYRFEKILQKEFSASDTDASGKGQVNTDFLIGDNNFTTFVEIKKPDTEIFDNKINRSGSWRLSKELTYAVSQILEQKTRGQIKIETTRNLPLSDGSYLKQHSYDSKCVLIFGNLEQEIKHCNDTEIDIMKKTFELYRRNSKNIDIITYDELYNRAFYICNKK